MSGNFLFVILGAVLGIIPYPVEYKSIEGTYELTDTVTVFIQDGEAVMGTETDGEDYALCTYLSGCVPFGTDFVAEPEKAAVRVYIASCDIPEEGYALKIGTEGIDIHASTAAGAFYAFMDILQMSRWGQERALPCCEINDAPKYPYRGLHMDVSRHFQNKEFLMKQMDAMALFKLNKLHLHLTDAAGWRLQIDKYPRLTEYAAWRPQREWKDWTAADQPYCEYTDPEAQGGYYTKDDIRDVLAYAALRHIDVIPEIEMPGHSEEVLAAYPELNCTNLEKRSGDLCPGKEATFEFLEGVLEEVIDLFPYKYIHIGGDEAARDAWANCEDCRRRMEEEGLENVEELQSYLIKRIERFVNSKGRTIIGWDEILDGGLAPNAIVMSWRNAIGGIRAARMGNDVIMTPSGYCYLSVGQDALFKEPAGGGGYLPLKRAWSFNLDDVVSSEGFLKDVFTDEERAEIQSHILGVQGCLWTEHISEPEHAEYMYYPRAFVIAENGWCGTKRDDYEAFKARVFDALGTLRYMGYNTFKLEEEYGDRPESKVPVEHLALGCPVEYLTKYSRTYTAGGDSALTNGVRGGWNFSGDNWQGFNGDMKLIIDLGEVKDVHRVEATFLNDDGAWINLPKSLEFSVSQDGETFETAGILHCTVETSVPGTFYTVYGIDFSASARYIRVDGTRSDRYGSWIFTDEIIVH
ncbi:MAG: family 20 glycosylhydrolase [Bacteroidales bacterium]|nr:family 20 glycosylhydrolase [Bacteroidales bacterium]